MKINLGLLFTEGRRAEVNSRPKLNFTSGTMIFHHIPHEQSICVYYLGLSIIGNEQGSTVCYSQPKTRVYSLETLLCCYRWPVFSKVD